MKKNSKLVAILTILCLLVSMLPVAAFAAAPAGHDEITEATVEPGSLVQGTEKDVKVTLTAAANQNAANYEVTLGNEKLEAGSESGATSLTYTLKKENTKVLSAGTYDLKVVKKEGKVVQDAAKVVDKALVVKPVVDANASKIKTDDEDADVDVNEPFQIDVDLLDSEGQNNANLVENHVLLVWAEDSVNAPSTAFRFVNQDVDHVKLVKQEKGFLVLEPQQDPAADQITFSAEFTRAAKFNLRAAYLDKDDAEKVIIGTTLVKDINGQDKLGVVSGSNKIEVTSNESVHWFKVAPKTTDKNDLNKYVEAQYLLDGKKWNDDSKEDKSQAIRIDGNGIRETEIDVTLLKNYGDGTNGENDSNAKAAKNVGQGVNVTVDTSSNNITLDKDSFVTDYQGKFTIKVTGKNDGDYKLYINADGKSVTVPVHVGATSAIDMKVTRNSADKLAWNSDFQNNIKGMKSYIRIQFYDVYNNIVTDLPEKDAEHFAIGHSNNDYVKVIEAPKSTYDSKDFALVRPGKPDALKDYFTIVAKRELSVGKYAVRFALENGKQVTVNFEIAKFGTAKDIKVDYDTQSVELNSLVADPTIELIDENGVVKTESNGVDLGYNGYAVDRFYNEDDIAWNVPGYPDSFKKGDKDGKGVSVDKGSMIIKDDDKYIGSKITVTAVSDRYGLSTQAVLTVAEDGRSMTFTPTGGAVNSNNTVNFQLVDGKGNTIALGSKVNVKDAYVVSQTNPDAKISVAFGNTSDLQDKGQGELKVSSDKAGKADIQVVVTDQNNKYYGGTLTYNFGAAGENASTFVVMNIGKTTGSKNNVAFTMDAAPIIKDNRTFVPYRALIEAFGAEVEWDKDNRVVTATLDGRKVALTIDSKEITVNGKKLEKEMDVAPYIANDRTMVPVRFVAEELGFTVTPIYNSNNGGTAAVYFAR